MDKVLLVTMGQTFDGKPLATLRNLPGEGADMTPEQMRALSDALRDAAGDCESRTMDRSKFYFEGKTRSYDLSV